MLTGQISVTKIKKGFVFSSSVVRVKFDLRPVFMKLIKETFPHLANANFYSEKNVMKIKMEWYQLHV